MHKELLLTRSTLEVIKKLTRLSSKIESRFTSDNANVEYPPHAHCWLPFELPADHEEVDFVQGLKTIAGNGDATTKEGLAIHMYTANTSMTNRAFCSNDGDMLILPQQGRLDIQTELGM